MRPNCNFDTKKLRWWKNVPAECIHCHRQSKHWKECKINLGVFTLSWHQFSHYGVLQENQYDLSENSKRILILSETYTKLKPLPFRASTPLCYLTCTLDVVQEKQKGGLYKEFLNDEMDCLSSVCVSNIDTCSSWLNHHSVKVSSDSLIFEVNSVMTPIKKNYISWSPMSPYGNHQRHDSV